MQDLSAADYDPNADKIAEEHRHARKGTQISDSRTNEVLASDYVEVPSHLDRKLRAEPAAAAGPKRDSFDMFADDDDIFAEPKEGAGDAQRPLSKPVGGSLWSSPKVAIMRGRALTDFCVSCSRLPLAQERPICLL